MTSEEVDKLEAQAENRIQYGKNPKAPGIAMCTVTPHRLLELIEAWRQVHGTPIDG